MIGGSIVDIMAVSGASIFLLAEIIYLLPREKEYARAF